MTPRRVIVLGQSLIKRPLDPGAPGLAAIAARLAGADLVFTNLEGTIRGRHGGWPTKSTFIHAGGPDVLDSLKALGVTALALSNNHAFDLGPAGILSTLEAVRERGFLHAGTGEHRQAAATAGRQGGAALVAVDCGPQPDYAYALDDAPRLPARPGVNRQRVLASVAADPAAFAMLRRLNDATGNARRKAGRVAVGYEAATEGERLDFYGVQVEPAEAPGERRRLDQGDLAVHVAAIAAAAAAGDVVLAYAHHHLWEAEWAATPAWFRELARSWLDAGASLVASHGVPMLQAIEVQDGRPVFHGLGNFVFHTDRRARYRDPAVWESVIADARFGADGRLAALELAPIVMGDDDPHGPDWPAPAPPERAARILERVAALSAPYGTRFALADGIARWSPS